MPQRRELIRAVALGVVGSVAGCNFGGTRETVDEDTPRTRSPTATLTPTPDAVPSTKPTSTQSPPTSTLTPTRTAARSPTPTATRTRTPAAAVPTLVGSGVDGGDRFGFAVAADETRAVVGAPGSRDPAYGGSAYVFGHADDGWTQQAKLTPENDGEQFGSAVAIDGDRILVSDPDGGPNGTAVGVAHVFARSNGEWTQEASLTPEHVVESDGYGSAVGLGGDRAFVGSPGDEDTPEENTGAAHVFSRSGGAWTQQAKLTPTGDRIHGFGTAIDVDGRTAAIGASRTNSDRGAQAGSAYVFEASDGEWKQEAELVADPREEEDGFGAAVAASGDRVLVGAPREPPETAYVYRRADGDWKLEARLDHPTGDDDVAFGAAVDLVDTTALIGEPDPPSGYNFGGAGAATDHTTAAYVFERDGSEWTLTATLRPDSQSPNGWAGWAASLAAQTAFVGSPGAEFQRLAGKVYAFTLR